MLDDFGHWNQRENDVQREKDNKKSKIWISAFLYCVWIVFGLFFNLESTGNGSFYKNKAKNSLKKKLIGFLLDDLWPWNQRENDIQSEKDNK